MKKHVYAAVIVAAVAGASAAAAADLPRGGSYYPAPAVGAYSWIGPYVGVTVGYQWGDTTNNPTSPSGIAGGITAGYNWQSGAFVFGGETDLQVSGADDTFAPFKFSNPWFGTLRGRVGYAMNNILFFVTGGLAYGGIEGQNLLLSESKTHAGWTIGGGAEIGLTPNWSAKAEYLYIDLTDRSYSITVFPNGLESNLLRFGVNYHF